MFLTRRTSLGPGDIRARFAGFAWMVLVVNLIVILWGAIVRALGAGAGCGEHWPLCNGSVMPAPHLKTLVEYGHRLTSGIALFMVVALVVYAWRIFPKGHWVRRSAAWALGFEVSEGLIGAGLVLLGHVAEDKSTARGYSLALHLINTLLLLAALAVTAQFATRSYLQWNDAGKFLRILLGLAALGIFVIAISGAIVALGDTLFPAANLAEGMRQDFQPTAHPFVRLRILHPMLAIVVGLYTSSLAVYLLSFCNASSNARRLSISLVILTMSQLALGGLNLIFLAPVPIQLVHLLLADLLWITFVFLSIELLTRSDPMVETDASNLTTSITCLP